MAIELIIALIVGINEAIKRAINLPPRYVPVLSMILGVLAVGFAGEGFGVEGIVAGILAGLASCGLYDLGAKSLLNK